WSASTRSSIRSRWDRSLRSVQRKQTRSPPSFRRLCDQHPMPSNQHVLRFAATRAGFEDAAVRLRGVLDARGLSDSAHYNVELAFEEVAMNIIRHGSPRGDIEAAIAFNEQEIILTFDDDGAAFDPREQPAPAVPQSIDDATVGGLGLVLVRKIISRMTYERT